MLQKAMMVAAALAATVVGAATGVIALAFAIYALLRPPLGPAGAAAGVAALSALGIGLAALIAARGAKAEPEPAEPESFGLMERLMELVRDKPLASAGVALAAGLMVMRNPAVIGIIVRTLLESWPGLTGAAPAKSRPGKR